MTVALVLVVGKVCKGSQLAVFLFFVVVFFLGFEMNVSIHFTLHCVPSGASHAKRTAGLGSHSDSVSVVSGRMFEERESMAKSASVAEQSSPLSIITIC